MGELQIGHLLKDQGPQLLTCISEERNSVLSGQLCPAAGSEQGLGSWLRWGGSSWGKVDGCSAARLLSGAAAVPLHGITLLGEMQV